MDADELPGDGPTTEHETCEECRTPLVRILPHGTWEVDEERA